MRCLLTLLLAAAAALAAAGCGGDDPGADRRGPLIRLGTKNFTEQFVLGHLYADALRAAGFRVDLEADLGSSELVDRALMGGGIDMYLEYTGVIVQELADEPRRPRTAEETYDRAKAFQARRGIATLEMTPGSDRLANAVLPEVARRHGLRSMPDLGRLGRYRYGGPAENELRFQGAVGVGRVYGLDFEYVPLEIDQRYAALEAGRVDVVDVFTTEGQLADRSRYVVLEDPEGIFGFQNIVPLVDEDVLRRAGPAFERTVNRVSERLTNAVLRRLNGAVDLDGHEPEQVARRFLREADLL